MVTLVVTQLIAHARQKHTDVTTRERRIEGFFFLLQSFNFDLEPDWKQRSSATGREIAIFRKVIFRHKLEWRAQYVIYSDYAAICRPEDGKLILATYVEPSPQLGDRWETNVPLGSNLLFITPTTTASWCRETSTARCHAMEGEKSLNR